MAGPPPSRRARLSGVGDTAFGALPGSSVLGIHAQAARQAIADAGLTQGDVDGVLCAYSLVEPHLMLSSVVAEYLGIRPAYSLGMMLGGATGCAMIMQAAMLVESGRCRHVLVVAGDMRLTGMSRDGAVAALARVGHPQFEVPYGPNIPAYYGLVASRYMHEQGATPEQLAHIAVTMRRHAGLHPGAHMREPITVADVLASRMIARPLRLLDCCLVSDGAAAVVVSAADASGGTRDSRIALLGAGQGHTHEHVSQAPSLTDFGCHEASSRALGEAGVTPAAVDVAEIYDSFTITLLIELESMGFFAKGEAGPAIAAGALGLAGRLPTNTHGGLLSFGHSGAAGGLTHVVEAVRQLRGEADARQVPDARLAFVHGDGGILSAHCSLVLARA
ncbi:MAG: thiolase family protein [Candidatus Rokubacteria bacterium]|nr:thiolase family protein [Candidatus Rokubacteria bacterium]MBI3108922.1 thiolase family protein [Candidatus Rokubacteria bacterium]